MHPHFQLPPSERSPSAWPALPIVTPDPPRKTVREKYGSLFYLGIVGLVVTVGLIGYFIHGVWSLRTVWGNIYVLHSSGRSEVDRVQAAYALSRDPRVTQHDYWDMSLRTPLPPLARYLLAGAVSADTVAADPRAYAMAVAKSEGWPTWLRLQLTRPLAYAAARGVPIPREPLVELSHVADGATALWAKFARAASADGDPEALEAIQATARGDGPNQGLARSLLGALDPKPMGSRFWLDQATFWLRRNHADTSRLWSGWEVRGDRLVRTQVSGTED
jgi:hypothetical protein